jgi:lipoate-protein ligase A
MALDEAIYRSNHTKNAPPTLRFYEWSKPSVSLGYFQDAKEEVDLQACQRQGIDVVRRPTGGKAVLHGQDLTYALVAKETNPLFPKDILGTYKVISQCIAEGLSSLGIKAVMSPELRKMTGSLKAFCFSEPSRYELLVRGKKICGSAQARSHGVFLQHGSVLMDFNPLESVSVIRSDMEPSRQSEQLRQRITCIREHNRQVMDLSVLCRALQAGFETVLGIHFFEEDLAPVEEELKASVLKHKYMNKSWNIEGKVVQDVD